MKHFIVPATNDQNVGTWIQDGCLERYESNLSGKLNLSEDASQCFWPIHTFHWLHSACFNNGTFCSELPCAYVAAKTLPVYMLLPHEITRQLQRQRHRRIITYFQQIKSSLFKPFRHGVHLNKIYIKSSIPTSQRTQPLSLQRSIGTYCEIHTQHKNIIRGKIKVS